MGVGLGVGLPRVRDDFDDLSGPGRLGDVCELAGLVNDVFVPVRVRGPRDLREPVLSPDFVVGPESLTFDGIVLMTLPGPGPPGFPLGKTPTGIP